MPGERIEMIRKSEYDELMRAHMEARAEVVVLEDLLQFATVLDFSNCTIYRDRAGKWNGVHFGTGGGIGVYSTLKEAVQAARDLGWIWGDSRSKPDASPSLVKSKEAQDA